MFSPYAGLYYPSLDKVSAKIAINLTSRSFLSRFCAIGPSQKAARFVHIDK